MIAPRTHHLSVSPVVTRTGRRYRILRAIPSSPSPSSGFPALYLLDGQAAFTSLSDESLAQTPGLALIGIAHDDDRLFAVRERWLDYTPAGRPDRVLQPDGPHGSGTGPTGGAAAFLHTLRGELRAEAEQGIAIDPNRRSLWGHSLGGLFVLYALFADHAAFHGHIPVSPSLWWGGTMIQALETACRPSPPPAPVLIMLGDREQRQDRSFPAPETLALIARLRGRSDIAVSERLFTGAGHRDALDASLPFALAFAAGLDSPAA